MIVALINVLFLSLQYRYTQSSSLHQKSKTAWNSSRTHPVVVGRNSISLGSSPTKFICCTRPIWSQSWLDDPRDLSAHQALTLKSWRRPWKARWSGYVDEAVIGSASLTNGNINGIIQTGNYKEESRILLVGHSFSWLFHERHKAKTTNSITPITRENKERNTQPQQIQVPP